MWLEGAECVSVCGTLTLASHSSEAQTAAAVGVGRYGSASIGCRGAVAAHATQVLSRLRFSA
jgi:hypothetical protein